MTGCRFQDADQSATLSTVLEIQGDLGHRSVRVYRRLSMQSALPEQGLNLAVLSIACRLHCRSRDQPVQFSTTDFVFFQQIIFLILQGNIIIFWFWNAAKPAMWNILVKYSAPQTLRALRSYSAFIMVWTRQPCTQTRHGVWLPKNSLEKPKVKFIVCA